MPGKVRRAARRPGRSDAGGHWISYSDMMASLLLVFVLAVCYSVYQYYNMLEIKTKQLNEQQAELDAAQITLVEREKELEEANATLVGKQEEVARIQIQLDRQQEELHAAQLALKGKEEELSGLQLKLNEQADKLAAMQAVLDEQKRELLSQASRIDALLGVKTDIIQALSTELNRAGLNARVDPDTGDIMLDSAVFFDTNSSTIKESGQELLGRFLPVYLSVLMRDEYSDYVGEIIIEGHTDSDGSYISNLRLSQERALQVATFCLNMQGLSGAQQRVLQNLMTAKGRSYSDPVYYADGVTENKEASRRVEFKFRLKDAEMIDEMNRILSESGETGI